ncbi:hypothetical protein [Magnetofaba australis]|uniref:hypothetical protein n=1 Tax=Magnetofaba australis TaxID=1472297 RepID=UPI000A19C387|nr:hypothetical protein [Magnetofaba australis]
MIPIQASAPTPSGGYNAYSRAHSAAQRARRNSDDASVAAYRASSLNQDAAIVEWSDGQESANVTRRRVGGNPSAPTESGLSRQGVRAYAAALSASQGEGGFSRQA